MAAVEASELARKSSKDFLCQYVREDITFEEALSMTLFVVFESRFDLRV